MPVSLGQSTPELCHQIIWQDAKANRYIYQFDSHQRLLKCTALEENSGYGLFSLNQQLIYNKQGWLEWVRGQEDSSHYTYLKGRLASIDFFQEGRHVYRYRLTTNAQGYLVGLRGIEMNNSGLQGYSTRYQLDKQGRYLQLEVFNDQGQLYYRVIQRDFVAIADYLAKGMRGIPYDLNRHPWPGWGKQFPVSEHLAGRIETYRYAAPQTPTQLIKRADVSVSYLHDRRGYITSQISTDALTSIQDTSRITHLNCP
ncbi:hypothetical protein [Spirosoma sp.]|uniref:hypothetical protein n=1 Tax=Spirosoma sp. TaxID=1899569 RepID=UPI0026388226|nr:hypothetical protein [Spirosoma sp.]MCX6215805.1 hypothetical protein [Spirosoma sp.]